MIYRFRGRHRLWAVVQASIKPPRVGYRDDNARNGCVLRVRSVDAEDMAC